jgi:hypothetical protein
VLKVGLPRFAALFLRIAEDFNHARLCRRSHRRNHGLHEGIEMLIVQASSNLRIPLVFAALTIIAAMSIVMDAGLRRHRKGE